MKKYTAPSIRVLNINNEDIIQTSGETAKVPTTVVTGANGVTVTATGYQATSFNDAYGTINSIAD